MKCQEFVDFVLDYFDGNLDTSLREHFDQHLQDCPPCVNYLKTYELTIRLGRESAVESTAESGAFPDELVKVILAARHTANRHDDD